MACKEGSDHAQNFVEEINYNEIEKIEVVGKGSFGVVWKAIWNEQYVAVKHIESEDEKKAFTVEVRQLSRVNHPNIVKLYGACTRNPVCLVMEYAEGGSLYNVLHCNPLPHYNVGHAISWALQCAQGVEYLHSMKPKPLIHRDLKPPNLLLIMGGRILKICDFGTACDQKTYMTNNKGSAPWMAPEVFECSNYTEKCDVFSWGIILWEVLARRKPFDEVGMTAFRIMWAVHMGQRPPLIKGCPLPLEQLMTSCWDKTPANRPPMGEVTRIMSELFPFFSGQHQPIRYDSSEGSPMVEDDADTCRSMSDVFADTQEEIMFPASNVSSHNMGEQCEQIPLNSNLSNRLHIQLPENKYNFNNNNLYENEDFSNGGTLTPVEDERDPCRSMSDVFTNTLEESMFPASNVSSHNMGDQCEQIPLNSHLSNRLHIQVPENMDNFIDFPNGGTLTPGICRTPPVGKSQMYNSHQPKYEPEPLQMSTNESGVRNTNGRDDSREDLDNVYLMLDPQLHPIKPDTSCEESVKIFEQHKQLAKDYFKVETEIILLSRYMDQLAVKLSEVEGLHQLDQQDTEYYEDELRKLLNEKESLVQLNRNLKKQLEIIKRQHSSRREEWMSVSSEGR